MNPFRTKRDEREKDRASEKRVREKSDLVRMVEEEAKGGRSAVFLTNCSGG